MSSIIGNIHQRENIEKIWDIDFVIFSNYQNMIGLSSHLPLPLWTLDLARNWEMGLFVYGKSDHVYIIGMYRHVCVNLWEVQE